MQSMKTKNVNGWIFKISPNYFIHAKKMRIHITVAFTENEQVKKMNKNT
jgi:hypothetical protein